MNHPRYSVLNLFDPLNAAATPRREVTTPDSLSSSTSDKENAEPSSSHTYSNYYESDKLTMTAFFNRTYKMQPKHYSPVALRKRLIDVGDITVDDASEMMVGLTITEENEGEELGDSFDEEDMQLETLQSDDALMTPQPKASSRERPGAFQTPQSSGPSCAQPQQSQHALRTPLADLSLDATPMPRKTGKSVASVSDASTPASSTEQDRSSPVTVVRAPHAPAAPIGSPLASVINALKFTEHEDEEVVVSEDSKQHHAITVVVSEPPETDDTLNLTTACLPSSSTAPLLSESCPSESAHAITVVVSEPPETDDTLNLTTACLPSSSTAPLLSESCPSESAHATSPPSVSKDLPAEHSQPPLLPVPDDSAYLSARPRPRLRSKTVSASSPSFDPHRASVDLQASFNWQLQCPEASFDLLNDRISFFGGDSFLADSMDDFDAKAEEEMMQALAKRLREKEAAGMKDAPTASATNRRRSGTDAGALDYIPSSPIVTSSQGLVKHDTPEPSLLVDNVPVTEVKPPRRRSLLANLTSSPSMQPSPVSRRGSLPLAEREKMPQTESGLVAQSPELPRQTSPLHRQSSPCVMPQITSPEAIHSCPPVNELSDTAVPSVTPAKISAHKPTLAPAPVQALRIVKRPKASALAQCHQRVGSTSSSATNDSGSGDAEVQSRPQDGVAPLAIPRVANKSVFKGVQRPPPGYVPPPMLAPAASGGPKAASILTKHTATSEQEGKAAKVSVKSKLTGVLGLRGRTAPEPEPATATQSKIQKPVVTAGGASAGATLGRAPPAAQTTTMSSKSSSSSSIPAAGSKVTGLRPPSRFATVSAAASSGIPRPAPPSTSSRLPGPSFGVPRSRLPGVTNGTAATVGRSGTIRR